MVLVCAAQCAHGYSGAVEDSRTWATDVAAVRARGDRIAECCLVWCVLRTICFTETESQIVMLTEKQVALVIGARRHVILIKKGGKGTKAKESIFSTNQLTAHFL